MTPTRSPSSSEARADGELRRRSEHRPRRVLRADAGRDRVDVLGRPDELLGVRRPAGDPVAGGDARDARAESVTVAAMLYPGRNG